MAKMPTFRTSESSARGSLSISRTLTSSVTLLGKEWCASQNESSSFRIWNLKTRRVVECRNVFFIETPPHLLPHSRRFSPPQGLEAPTIDFFDNSLDGNYSSRNDMIHDAKDSMSALDFEANDPLLIPTPGGSSPGGVTPQESPSSPTSVPTVAPETAPAPAPASAAPQATATGTGGYAMQPGVTHAVLAVKFVRLQLQTLGQIGTTAQLWQVSLPEGQGSTGAQARIFKTRISSQLGHCAPTRRHVRHRERLRHHPYARKLFGGGARGENPQHLQGGYGPSTSGVLECGI